MWWTSSIVLNDENDHERDDSIAIPIVSSKDIFQDEVVTVKYYLLQHEQNIPKIVHYIYIIEFSYLFVFT